MNLLNNGPDNSLLPDGAKPLPDPMLTSHVINMLLCDSSRYKLWHISMIKKTKQNKTKHSNATITKLRSLELLIKTPLLHILYYINGLTHDFGTRTGGWEFDRSHGAGTSSPSHWQQVEEQAPKPVGWTMCFLLMTLIPVQKLCVNIYVYIYACTFLIRVLL